MLTRLALPARAVLLGVLAFAAFATAPFAPSADAQFLPAVFYGGGLKSGQKVEALIDGKTCADTTASAKGEWVLQVPAGGPCNPQAGAVIRFKVDGALATASPPAIWQSGGIPSDSIKTGYTLTVEPGTGTADQASDDGGSSSTPLIVGGAVVGLAVLAGGAFLMLRRRSAA